MSYKNYRNLQAVCHAFANNESQNGQSSNIFFSGTKAYSYGSHYVLAEKFNNYTVINDKGYSSSTSRHISYMFSALQGQKTFDTTEIVPELVYTQLQFNLDKLKKANKPEIYTGAISYLIHAFYEFWNNRQDNFNINICGYQCDDNESLGVPYFELIKEISLIPELTKGAANVWNNSQEKLKKALKDIQDAKNKEKHAQSIKDFLSHKCYSVAYRPQNFLEILRISKDGLFIETSASARVNIKSALTLYKMIVAKKDIKGYQIDHYTVISINGTLKIGCHNIDMKSVKKVGNQLLKMSIAE